MAALTRILLRPIKLFVSGNIHTISQFYFRPRTPGTPASPAYLLKAGLLTTTPFSPFRPEVDCQSTPAVDDLPTISPPEHAAAPTSPIPGQLCRHLSC